jgi:hypothetical protein
MLSDNEVFSIGDAIQSVRSNWQRNDCKIEIIHAREDGDIDFTINQNGDKGTYRNCLDNFRKAKPVLFVTEDGIDVFEGDNVHWVINGHYGYELRICENHIKSSLLKGDVYKIFSSFEKAQDYIMLNKSVLSINDIVNISKGTNTMDMIGERIKELVKSRL